MIIKLFKVLLIILILSNTKHVFAQNARLKAQIFLMAGDTLRGHISAERNIFYKTMTRESSYNQRIRFINNINKKQKFKWEEVKSMEIIDLEGKPRVFVQMYGYPRLLEVVYENKVAWYKNYYYDIVNSTQDVSYEIFDEKGTKYSIGLFNSKKNKLEALCRGKDHILAYIKDNQMTDENILKVLMMYESGLK
ncbi:hypothetical protein GZH53_06345 [Flavihumibacter sp. R14]|nr:hypothetical protein [Flavihumibacter soli]